MLSQILKISEREKIEVEIKTDGQGYVNYILELALKEDVKASSLLAEGRPFEQVVHLAKGLIMDLIVMGTYGRRSLDRVLTGSVAERVIEYSPCPVLVAK